MKIDLPEPKDDGTALDRMWARASNKHTCEAVLGAIFKRFVTLLGEQDARNLFAPFAPKAGGSRNTDRDTFLLYFHDRLSEEIPDPQAVPGTAAKELYAATGNKYGASAPAIEKQIQRLLNERKRQRANTQEAYENIRKLKF